MNALLRYWVLTSLFFGLIPLSCVRHTARRVEPPDIGSALDTTTSDTLSPHARLPKRLLITVAPSIDLEVVDWGGQGPPLLFLAGYGNTAHIFENFAAQFSDHYHVVAVTRRGFGSSSRPATGYDSETLSQDLVAVMDSLQLPRAVIVSHSFGGSEANFLAAYHPDRVTGLIYLDSAFDFASLYTNSTWTESGTPFPPKPSYDSGDVASITLYLARITGPGYPTAEVLELMKRPRVESEIEMDSIEVLVQRGAAQAEFTKIHAPVLAIYGVPSSPEEKYPFFLSLDSLGRQKAERRFLDERSVMSEQRAKFRQALPKAKVLEIIGGRHYVFLTHAPEVTHEIQLFLGSLDR